MMLVFLVSSCMNLTWCIERVHYEFLHISSVPLAKGLYINVMIIFVLRPIFDARYAGDKGVRKSTIGYCTYVGGNLVTWHFRKQNVVSCSCAEAEYRAMAATAHEMVWLKSFV